MWASVQSPSVRQGGISYRDCQFGVVVVQCISAPGWGRCTAVFSRSAARLFLSFVYLLGFSRFLWLLLWCRVMFLWPTLLPWGDVLTWKKLFRDVLYNTNNKLYRDVRYDTYNKLYRDVRYNTSYKLYRDVRYNLYNEWKTCPLQYDQ